MPTHCETYSTISVMLFYIFLLVCILFTSSIVSLCNKKIFCNVFKVITFLLLFIPAAIRYDVGVDYLNYIDIFDDISNGGALYIEPGYWLLNYIVAINGGSAQIVLAISAFITLFFFFKGVENSRWPIYAVFFFIICWIWFCSTVRQMISCSLAFYAWRECDKKQYWHAAIAIIFAWTFHYSSFIYPLLFFATRKITISKWIMLFIFGSCVFLSFRGIFKSNLLDFASKTVYGGYVNTDWVDAIEKNTGIGQKLRFLIYFMVFAFFPINSRKSAALLYLFFLYGIIDVLSEQMMIISRIGRGFIFIWLPIIYHMATTKYKYRQIVTAMIYVIWSVYFIASLNGDFNHCIPYRTIFSN